jgi:hypothetical protein
VTRCAWVDSQKAAGFLVTMACMVAGISTTVFYDWAAAKRRGPSQRDWEEALLINEIHDLHAASDGPTADPTFWHGGRSTTCCLCLSRAETCPRRHQSAA